MTDGWSTLGRRIGEAVETAAWGGSVGRYERVGQHQIRVSRHRREVWRAKRRAHWRRLKLFAVPAVVGAALLGWWLTRPMPVGELWAGLVGAALLLPFPVEASR